MQTIYITEHGLHLKKKSNRILVKKEGKTYEEIPVLDLKRLLIFGNCQVSTDLMKFLASRGIEVAFLSGRGRFRFRLVPETSKNIYLRLAQHDKFRDPAFRLRISRAIIKAKIKNQRGLLVRYRRNQPEMNLDHIIDALHGYHMEADSQGNLEALMGLEGLCSKTYFAGFAVLLKGGFHFEGRRYHPAPDPINALLSFGYMMVFNEIQGCLEAHGLDPFLGFLHGLRYGRASLAADLVEVFRSPVVDRLVLYLINKKMIKEEYFEKKEKEILLDDTGRKIFLANFENFMTASFLDPAAGTRKNFRNILREQVACLEKTLLHDIEYKPFEFST